LNKLLAGLLVIAFVFFSSLMVLTWSIEADIRNPDAYLSALEGAGFFEVPYELIRAGEIPVVGDLLLTEGPLSVVSEADLEAVARELAPLQWLKAQLEESVRDLVALVQPTQQEELPELVISLSEVKVRAMGEPGDRALAIVVGGLPICAPDRAPLEPSSNIPVCKPGDIDPDSFIVRLKSFLNPLVERLPDTYRVTWQPDQRAVLEDVRRVGRTLDQLRFVLLLLLALNLALLGLIWLLVVRSPAEWLRWTGVSLFFLGLVVLMSALLIPWVIDVMLDSATLVAGDRVSTSLVQILEQAAQDYLQRLFHPARLSATILVAVGLLFAVLSPLFPGRRSGRPLVPARPLS
jgi:hypothetical protein